MNSDPEFEYGPAERRDEPHIAFWSIDGKTWFVDLDSALKILEQTRQAIDYLRAHGQKGSSALVMIGGPDVCKWMVHTEEPTTND